MNLVIITFTLANDACKVLFYQATNEQPNITAGIVILRKFINIVIFQMCYHLS